jgi:hypothetical protein
MSKQPDRDMFARELYLAGERVVPGLYKQVDSTRVVELDFEGFLPASLDGRVACFVREQRPWGQMQQTSRSHQPFARMEQAVLDSGTAPVSSESQPNASLPVLLKGRF